MELLPFFQEDISDAHDDRLIYLFSRSLLRQNAEIAGKFSLYQRTDFLFGNTCAAHALLLNLYFNISPSVYFITATWSDTVFHTRPRCAAN